MADESEIGKKRSIIIPESDDDIPVTDGDARSRLKVPDQSPAPLTIESMARYLRELTTAPVGSRGNAYPLKDSYSVVKSHYYDGSPTPPVTPKRTVANVFASSEDREVIVAVARQMFDSDTIRKLRDPQTGLHEVLRTFIPATNGRNPEIETPGNAPDIQKKISSVLKKNRFNPDPGNTPPFLPLSTASSKIDERAIGKGQSQLGVYDSEPSDVTYEQMKKVGLALMLRATGEFIGHDGDPTSTLNEFTATIPGSAQLLGSKVIDRKSMWAGDLSVDQGRPPGIGIREKSLSLDIAFDDGAHSYGALNTHLEPFAGFAPVGMLTLGAALVTAIKLLSEGFELIFQASAPPAVPGSDSTAPSPDGSIRMPGSSRFEPLAPVESIVGFFGFTPTKHNYSQAFDRGVDVFFGFDLVNGSKRLQESPGYYVVMIREIIRSGSRIVESIVNAFKSGPVGAVLGLLGLVDVIRGSKIVGYFNMVATLGDILLTMEDEGLIDPDSVGALAAPGNLPFNGKFSTIDRLLMNPASRISKNRISENDITLAWRTSATPSAYLLPAAVINAADYMPSDSKLGLTMLPDVPDSVRNMTVTDTSAPRLHSDVIKKIEAELDSEYVPFYFHDLRTNEIVSFHAFISACTDSFSVSHDSTNYYGRVDPVRVYNRTERTINLTFNVVATNRNDFDVMWWKINKLVTLLYPQWSRGRKLIVTEGKDEFIQPFSQIPTSSPVIRLRLGDVFKSNYSKFTLARLFGLGTTDFITDELKTDPARVQKLIKLNNKMTEIKKKMLTKPASLYDVEARKHGYQVGSWAIVSPTENFTLTPAGGKVPTLGGSLPGQKRVTPIKKMGADVRVKIIDIKIVVLNTGQQELEYIATVDKNSVPVGFSEGPYAFTFNMLRPDDEEIKGLAIKQGAEDPGLIQETNINKIKDFFSTERNALVKSFESVSGRGLAGVISAMSFDWKAPTWDTSSINGRAPQWCQITMTFLPIHDIAPGLDENGFNRAPIYNVGDIVNHVASDIRTDGESERTFSNYHANVSKMRQKK